MKSRVLSDRRKFLAGTSTAVTIASAGCVGNIFSCGPGDTSVNRILSAYDSYVGEFVSLKGEVTYSSDSDRIFVINDTTGDAVISGTSPESDRCVVVSATVVTRDDFLDDIGLDRGWGRTYVHMLLTDGSQVRSG
jgi:hypothetical protein